MNRSSHALKLNTHAVAYLGVGALGPLALGKTSAILNLYIAPTKDPSHILGPLSEILDTPLYT